MSGDTVVFLAYTNPAMPQEKSMEALACKTCRNKTWVVIYTEGTNYPRLHCPICNCDGGMIGWASEHDKIGGP